MLEKVKEDWHYIRNVVMDMKILIINTYKRLIDNRVDQFWLTGTGIFGQITDRYPE